MKHILLKSLVTGALLLGMSGITVAADSDEFVYGRDLMTQEELQEHRAKMRSLATEEEREAYRMEHHGQMQERARELGVDIPDEPLPRGRGMGYGPRDGSGRGPGMGGGPMGGGGNR